ncbi:MAG: HAD hydrolase family protein [Acidobacteriota bacterium]|nr:HAD hydrolase family protein [Acidobacteriota bacterium]
MHLVFTDLDGTLLDHATYSWDAARPALEHLRRSGIPWVIVTSKTRAEVEYWRHETGNAHPFIVENGGAAYIPAGYFPFPIEGAARRGPYDVLEWGAPYPVLVEALGLAARTAGCAIRGFHGMTTSEVAESCGMPHGQAILAQQREYDEPFLLLDPEREDALTGAVEARGLRLTRGGRFHHILGGSDKARAVAAVAALFARRYRRLRTIGLGDGPNDATVLREVSHAVLIRSPRVADLRARVPRGVVTRQAGPAGWNRAVLSLTRP